jgi:ABC-type branched-subunit amino acid transport system permease subunit
MRNWAFFVLALLVAVATFAVARAVNNAYGFFAGYVVLQYIVLATAWNILGGYTGYVNFGTAAFFALGAYSTVVLHKTVPLLPLPVMMLVGGTISGLIGLGMGYLTLRLKLIATTLSGGLMGMAGAPLPYYVTYLDPASGFSLSYAVNTIAMPLIGGTSTWAGPVIGALLLGTLQQVATVTISSALSLLIVGVLLVVFVVAAPKGIVGWFRR